MTDRNTGLAFQVAALVMEHKEGEQIAMFVLQTFGSGFDYGLNEPTTVQELKEMIALGRSVRKHLRRAREPIEASVVEIA